MIQGDREERDQEERQIKEKTNKRKEGNSLGYRKISCDQKDKRLCGLP